MENDARKIPSKKTPPPQIIPQLNAETFIWIIKTGFSGFYSIILHIIIREKLHESFRISTSRDPALTRFSPKNLHLAGSIP